VLLGDVWICSGQSNMQMSVAASMNAKAEIAAAKHPRIRFFGVPWAGLRPGGPQVMRTEPQETVAARWEVCSPETVGGFSAVGYFFAAIFSRRWTCPSASCALRWAGRQSRPGARLPCFKAYRS